MTRSVRRAGALLAATLACAAAQALPVNIGSSGTLTWEQVRFYAPGSGADGTYTSGVQTKIGVVPADYCSGTDNCGTAMSFATTYGGALMVTASDDGNGVANTTTGLVMQDLSPNYGGLGVVSRNANGAVSGADEINRGDVLTLAFANTVKLVGLHLWDHNHSGSDLNGGAEKFGLSIDGGAMQQLTLDNFPWWGGSSGLVGKRFTFSYINEDYYVGAVKIAAVPEPQSLALLLLGLAAIGAASRRRRSR